MNMRLLNRKLLLGLLFTGVLCSLFTFSPVQAATAPDVFTGNPGCSSGAGGAAICGGSSGNGIFAVIKSVVDVLLMAAGIVSIIVIIVGGISYATAAGDASKIKTAKDTVLYAVIGLAVAIMSFAIVTYVTSKL